MLPSRRSTSIRARHILRIEKLPTRVPPDKAPTHEERCIRYPCSISKNRKPSPHNARQHTRVYIQIRKKTHTHMHMHAQRFHIGNPYNLARRNQSPALHALFAQFSFSMEPRSGNEVFALHLSERGEGGTGFKAPCDNLLQPTTVVIGVIPSTPQENSQK